MKRFVPILSTVVLLLGAGITVRAQNAPSLRAWLDTDSIRIGDHFTLTVEVEKDLVQVVDFPYSESGYLYDKIEILASPEPDTLSREGRRLVLAKKYLLTCFDAGEYPLGQFPVLYMDKNIVDTLYAPEPMFLYVEGFEIDTATMKIYDIAGPIRTPLKPGEFTGYLVIVLLLLQSIVALAYIAVKRWKRRTPRVSAPRVPDEPPHVTAIRELEKLQSEKLWQNNRHKQYYTRLTDIVRRYMERRYGINAPDMITEEILGALTMLRLKERALKQMKRLLTTADYVKFAKYIPGTSENQMAFDDAYYFIEDTKMAPLQEETEEAERGKEGSHDA